MYNYEDANCYIQLYSPTIFQSTSECALLLAAGSLDYFYVNT